MHNPLAMAVRGKRWQGMTRRAVTLSRRYGITPAAMERRVERMVHLLEQFDCPATFPTTAAALERHAALFRRLSSERIEFAAHGYSHLDHSGLSLAEQRAQFARARRAFARSALECRGFRAPYARWNSDTLTAIRSTGWRYDSSETLVWRSGRETDAYRHALQFYHARPASTHPALPRLVNGVVEIPFALPDDEALVERLAASPHEMAAIWKAMLDDTYARGELLVMNLHPERFALYESPLVALLEHARRKPKRVWFARLDEIAEWWLGRTGAQKKSGRWHGGAQSVLCLSGDIDAMTLGDYVLRVLGR